MSQPSSTPVQTPPRPHSMVYPLPAYDALFAYAQRQLRQRFVDPQFLTQSTSLIEELYDSQLALPHLLDVARTHLENIYLYNPDSNRVNLAPVIAAAPAYLRDGTTGSALRESELAITHLRWLDAHHPDTKTQVSLAQEATLDHAFKQAGRTRVLELELDRFMYHVYDGLTLLRLPQLTTAYRDYVYARQCRYETNGVTAMNLWLWHAHVMGSALWALAADTTALDALLTAVLNRALPPDFDRLAPALPA